MKNKKKIYWLLFAGFLLLAGCGGQATDKEQENQLTVVATNSILADMAKEIGKEHVIVHSIVPVGTDPHEHEVLPEDIKKASDADVILYNS